MRKNSIKNTRINGEVQRELGRIISREIKDPRISSLTSVVAVEVAPDLKSCKAYISVLGDEAVQKSTLEGLNTAVRVVPTPSWESIWKLPPVISASILNRGTPKPTLRVVRVV